MTTNAQTDQARTPSPSPAERMRAYRKRRRSGLRHVDIMLHVTEIEALVRKGYLPADERNDIWAHQIAIHELLRQVLNDSA